MGRETVVKVLNKTVSFIPSNGQDVNLLSAICCTKGLVEGLVLLEARTVSSNVSTVSVTFKPVYDIVGKASP